MKFLTVFALSIALLSTFAAAHRPTVYLIRHGEKPSNGNVRLSSDGEKRAQCLRKVFGSSSDYNIGYIMAQAYKSDGSRERPYLTVKPLAKDLGLKVDTSCGRDDHKCVKKAVKKFHGSGNILICWEHAALTNIVESLGDSNAPTYPHDDFGLIWTDPSPYGDITAITKELCPELGN
ncbi:hypothetical protein BGZ46_003436 [Entomortierella lignicola]|nr:hypothetical protein BGZ46_003436 [Entomortierella lignicola]